jgi:hypothetical protein
VIILKSKKINVSRSFKHKAGIKKIKFGKLNIIQKLPFVTLTLFEVNNYVFNKKLSSTLNSQIPSVSGTGKRCQIK